MKHTRRVQQIKEIIEITDTLTTVEPPKHIHIAIIKKADKRGNLESTKLEYTTHLLIRFIFSGFFWCMWFQTFLDLQWEAGAYLWNCIRMFPPGGIPLSRRVYLLEYKFWIGFAGLEKLRIPKAIANPPESLESLQSLENLSSLIAQKRWTNPNN